MVRLMGDNGPAVLRPSRPVPGLRRKDHQFAAAASGPIALLGMDGIDVFPHFVLRCVRVLAVGAGIRLLLCVDASGIMTPN